MFRPIGIFGNKDDGVYPPHLTYSCSIVLEKQSMVVVSPSPNAKTLEFAISFRVRQWVDENKRVLVVPFYEPNDDFTPLWLIPENTIATIVNNPAIDTRSDSPPFIASTSVASIVPKEHVCTFGLLVRQEDVPSINDFYGYLCIDSDCDEGNDCEIVVEIVIHCPIDEIGNCTEVSPLQINGEYSKLNCTNT
ncbi:unnamed protein product, partial [Mesorhabditis belari]|uniref:Uncharacterized protein n=1 Tax=Mesorhabditis belari TaxID=2138241 RepID=A0AAF3ECH1_9BILA